MKNKKGFTLIELLVVVLIIGILAAIAIPQYLKAVRKAEMMQLLVWAKAVYNAQERIYLINGKYSSALSDLDISLPITRDKTPGVEDSAESTKIYLLRDKYEFGWNWAWAGGKGFPIVFNQKESVASQAVNPTYFIIVKSGAADQCDGRQHCIVCQTYNVDKYNFLCESLVGKLIPNLSKADRAYYVLP